MGLLDDAKNLADRAVDAIGGDKAQVAVDQATDKIDEATGGAYSAKTDQVDNAASSQIDPLAND